jgi:hypothetical protein
VNSPSRNIGGPYDSSDINAPLEAASFGSIAFVPNALVSVRAEVDQESGKMVAIAFDYKSSSLQVQAFASPKGVSIWNEVVEDIASNLTSQGVKVASQVGPFGLELLAELPDQSQMNSRVRMFGFSGDRWLLRGTIAGSAITDLEERTFLEDIFRGVVVTRGEIPLPPREPLPLELPAGAIVPKGSID